MNLVTPKAAAKRELLFNIPASVFSFIFYCLFFFPCRGQHNQFMHSGSQFSTGSSNKPKFRQFSQTKLDSANVALALAQNFAINLSNPNFLDFLSHPALLIYPHLTHHLFNYQLNNAPSSQILLCI